MTALVFLSILPLRKNFALKEELDWVIMQLQAGGFWTKWNREMFDEKVSGGHHVRPHHHQHIPIQVFLPPKEESRPEPLTMDHLAFAFSLYVIGIIFSIILYAGERLVLLLCAM